MNPLRILAVEDNPADLRLLSEYLRGDPAARFEVAGAQTMREALELISAGGFDAVLLDLNLPDCTGLDGLDRIGAHAPLLPIIVLTGQGDAATGLLALAKNAQDFLVKGKIDGDVLTRSIRYAIERQKAKEVVRQQNAELDKRAGELQAANVALKKASLSALNLMQDAIEDRERAEWLARLPKENPEPVLRVAVDGAVLYLNPAAMNSGWADETGRSLAPILRPLVERAMSDGMAVEQDIELGARTYDVLVAAFSEERYANLYGRDITARKQWEVQVQKFNRALNALGHSGQALMRATDEARFFDEACKIIVQDCGFAMVWIGLAGDDPGKSVRPVAYAGFEDGYLQTLKLTWADTERGRGPTGSAIRSGQVCRCLDMLGDPKFLPWRAEAVKRGYASSIALPLMAGGKAFGALTIYAREPVGFTDEEVKLLTDLAADFAQGITGLRTRAEKERAEKAVRESEERYHTLFSAMTDGFALHEIVCDRQGNPRDYRFLDVNPAFESQTGLKRADVLGKTVLEVMPGTEPVWIERYGRVVLTGQPDHFEHFSAELGRYYEVTAFRAAPGRFAVIFDDVTELRAMQRREQEDAVQLAWGQSALDTINAMSDGVVLMNADGTVTSVNPAVEYLTGLTGGAIVGRNVESLLPTFMMDADLKAARHSLALMRRGRIPDSVPIRWKGPAGKVLHVLPSVSLMNAPEGGRRVIVLTLKDVTELHETTQRLERNERKYRELVENANSIIMRITPDHNITFFNEYAQKFFGYSYKEILGKNVLGTIVPVTDESGRDLRETMLQITEHPELHGTNENENIRKDGGRVWVYWSNRAIRDDEGKVVEILCVGADITERKRLEAEAQRYQQRLRELAERLAATEEEDRWRISRYIHDTIIQNLSLSSIRLGSIAKPLADADQAEVSGKLLQIRGLLDEAIDECRMVMSDLTPALLYELGLIPALNDLAQQIETKHGTRMIVEDDGQEQPMSHPLRGLLFQSVRELVMNSLKHAGPCEIRVSLSCRDGNLLLRVADNGKGFGPKKTNPATDHQGGFGLLNIRQRLEGLGGRLDIESAPGRGVTTTISVPMRSGDGGQD